MTKIIPTQLSYIVEIPKIKDEGFLSFAEGSKDMPFEIKRIYYISKVKPGSIRGLHAHKKTKQLLFCLSGSIKITLDDGKNREELYLTDSNKGVYLDRMMWHQMSDFRKDTVLLVLASEYYDESDYIRSYNKFLQAVSQKNIFSAATSFVHSLANSIKGVFA